jgi:hypothetical protein
LKADGLTGLRSSGGSIRNVALEFQDQEMIFEIVQDPMTWALIKNERCGLSGWFMGGEMTWEIEM